MRAAAALSDTEELEYGEIREEAELMLARFLSGL